MSGNGWIGVDLDGTLAKYTEWQGISHIGEPIANTLRVVKELISKGIEVRIFTARVSSNPMNPPREVVAPIHDWCIANNLPVLEVTCIKDFEMVTLIDDRAVRVVPNTGCVLVGKQRALVLEDLGL